MANNSSKYVWVIALLASAGAYYIWRRSKQSDPPSLLNNKNYMDYDFSKFGDRIPLGYRSNNPLNIRYNAANNWRGKVTPPAEGKYGKYERFEDLVHGYRAALVLLRGNGYILKGLNTIRKIITKWAPADDHNYTQSYIDNVSRLTGIDPDAVIMRSNKDALTKIVYAMSISENGYKHKYKDENGNTVTVDLMETYGLPNMDIVNLAWEAM